jgi:hypothetical protein
MKKLFLVLTIIGAAFFTSCEKDDVTPPTPPAVDSCKIAPVVTFASVGPTISGQSLGTVTVTSPLGSGVTYNINSGSSQPSPNFFNLPAGNYIVKATTAKGCTDTTQVTVAAFGPKYYAVRALVLGYCGPCHLNGAASGNKNFDSDGAIENSWDRIRIRCVTGSPSFMPQGGQLTAADKQKITDWVNAGHRLTD